MNLWPHQKYGITETLSAIERGYKRILVTSPTGGGKTRMMSELIRAYLERDKKVALYTNRRMLVQQTSDVLRAQGLSHGVRSAGYADERHFDLQVSSIQTELTRVLKKKLWKLHDADLVIVDEAHLQSGSGVRKVLDAHVEDGGAAYVGFTATPLDLGDLYDHLIVAGTNSELRACGGLVPCSHFGPDEPDLRNFKVPLGKDLTEKQAVKAMMRDGIFGRVLDEFNKLNSTRRPTILFAPGVAESIWFAEQFVAVGITAAHIDGQEVWINGKVERTSSEARARILEGSRKGEICVLCSRFVLREGIDCPWLAHGILATVFGSLQSYLQSGGRLLRAHADVQSVTIQDHGGNWWRHGSLNADREWTLEYTASTIAAIRGQRLRTKKCRKCQKPLKGPFCYACNTLNEVEPARCPKCSMIVTKPVCPCGHEMGTGRKSRPVVQQDGTLKQMTGDIFRPRSVCRKLDGPAIWEKMYYRSRNAHRTFNAATTLFAMENNWQYPDPNWPLMPKEELDWFRRVSDVPQERLT